MSTTLYRIGGNLQPSIIGGAKLRDLAEYDVLDELLIVDGALTKTYRAMIVIEPDFIEDAVLDRIETWQKAGGTLILVGSQSLRNIAGEPRLSGGATVRVATVPDLAPVLAGMTGVDGKFDGLMTCRRGEQVFIYNANDKTASITIDSAGASADIVIEPHTIWSNR